MKLLIFNHKLYGKAVLLPNQWFNRQASPKTINYVLIEDVDRTTEVKASGIDDCGIEVSDEYLHSLGY